MTTTCITENYAGKLSSALLSARLMWSLNDSKCMRHIVSTLYVHPSVTLNFDLRP